MSDAEVALQHTLYHSRNPTRRYLHRSRYDWVTRQLRAAGPVSVAAELGPGSGVYLPTLAAVAQTAIALDRYDDQLRAARSAVQAELNTTCATSPGYVQGDLHCLPLRAQSVDLLLCSEVIEHLPDSRQVLANVATLLAPGGRLILTTPQPTSPVELLARVAFLPGIVHLLRVIYREPLEPMGHINVLSRARLEAQLKAAGLRVLQRHTTGLYVPLIGEFGGRHGQRLLAWLAGLLRRTPLSVLLWTQCYVLEPGESGTG